MQKATGAMIHSGSDPFTAHQRALQLLDNTVRTQATVLAYNRDFALIALLFVLGLPLVWLLRRGHSGAEVEVMAE
jgi:DHA2 family multidrug resistance protein